MKTPHTFWFAAAALSLALPARVMAQPPAAQPPPESAALQSSGSTASAFASPVATATLAEFRGGTSIVNNDMQLAGTTANNTAINVATGTNAITGGAFSSMSGLPVVIQNSGANVLIQNAVILNLQVN